jgi:hypothetical protein
MSTTKTTTDVITLPKNKSIDFSGVYADTAVDNDVFDDVRAEQAEGVEAKGVEDDTASPDKFAERDELDKFMREMTTTRERPRNSMRRRQLLIKAKQYQVAFAHKLTDYKSMFQGLAEKSEDELDSLIDELRIIVSSTNQCELYQQVFTKGLALSEGIGPVVGLKLQGLSKCASIPVVRDLVNEIALESEIKYIPPHIRLAIIMIGICSEIHTMNSNTESIEYKSQMQKFMESDVNAEKYKEFDDL